MRSPRKRPVFLASIFLSIDHVLSQCVDDYAQYPFAPVSGLSCGTDPHDATYFAVLVRAGGSYGASPDAITATWTGTDSVLTTQSYVLNVPTDCPENKIPFSVQNTAIQSGALVTLVQYGQTTRTFTSSPVTSNYFVDATATVTSTVVDTATDTDTTTDTQTSTLPQSTTTDVCTTGRTFTTTRSRQTIKKTDTITPAPIIVTTTKVSTRTVSTTCIPRSHWGPPNQLLARKLPTGAQNPWCPQSQGSPKPTTYTTGTTTLISDTTTTETTTTTVSTTTTTTVSPTPPTTTVCNEPTVTVTPKPSTTTITTSLPPSKSTTTKTITVNTTVFPHGRPVCCGGQWKAQKG